ncbi:hypothetical protein [Listeria booriae]|uniref:hypothetical protein n=1 Tax=Listeria booriae TaxID=1552123 RepID=UPI00162A1B31|nr:hypothetical protein [Listeria booriae]MBC1801099.1 hypothetical protein [Listeria booriae]
MKWQAPISECPHCHSDKGYFIRSSVTGHVNLTMNFDGSEFESDCMYDGLRETPHIYTYCINCEKRLFKAEEIGG